MNKKKEENSYCATSNLKSRCCKVESLVTISSKGQIVLSQGIREAMNLKEGEKLVSILMNPTSDTPFVVLMKADYFEGLVRNCLSPIMEEIFSDNNKE